MTTTKNKSKKFDNTIEYQHGDLLILKILHLRTLGIITEKFHKETIKVPQRMEYDHR